MKTTILIADDHEVFRHGLSSLLREREGWDVVAVAADGEEALRLAEGWRPDIVILDLEMPGLSGIEATRHLKRAAPESRIVVLSMYDDAYYQTRAREAGASAYVLKTEPVSALFEIIDLVLRGATFVSNSLKKDEPTALRSAMVDLRALSPRELEILRMVAEGKRTAEIAQALGLSVKSVETYRSRLMQKVGIDNVAGLVRFAIRAGLIAP